VTKLNAGRTPTQGTQRRSLLHSPPSLLGPFLKKGMYIQNCSFSLFVILTDFADVCPVSMTGKENYFGQRFITEAILLDISSSRSCVVF